MRDSCTNRLAIPEPCFDCGGKQGRSFTWDDDLDIRHEDWVNCGHCNGTGTRLVVTDTPAASLADVEAWIRSLVGPMKPYDVIERDHIDEFVEQALAAIVEIRESDALT